MNETEKNEIQLNLMHTEAKNTIGNNALKNRNSDSSLKDECFILTNEKEISDFIRLISQICLSNFYKNESRAPLNAKHHKTILGK